MSPPRTELLSVVRLSELLANVSGNEAIVAMVVDEFLSHADAQLGAVTAALQAEDAGELLQTTHHYKGSLAAIYAVAALEAATMLEAAAKRRDYQAARAEHVILSERTAELVCCLRDWRVEHPVAKQRGRTHA